MESNQLIHYGVKGQRWGIRRYQNKDGSLTAAGKRRYSDDGGTRTRSKASTTTKRSSSSSASKAAQPIEKKKPVKDMTDDEIRKEIARMDLEKKYTDLLKQTTPKLPTRNSDKARAFISDVIEKSGKNIATQFTTYVMGSAVNKAFAGMFNERSIVNPKKGQKD